ncbi:MAG: YhdP family protein, partial [Betaproteobacteria bacterium]
AWQAVAKRWQAATPASAPRSSAEGAEAEGGGYLPATIALHAQQLTFLSRTLTHVVAGVSQADGVWRVNLDADQLDGYVEYRPPRRAGAGLVYARLSRLALPKSEADSVETLLERPAESSTASSVPALDIVVGDFTLRDKKLGRVEVEATNRLAPGTGPVPRESREWRLTRLAIANADAQLTGSGNWAPGPGGRRRATLNFTLDIADSGALLERLGTPKALRGGKGKMAGQVSWVGSPLTPDFASMSGQIDIALAAGQFLKAEPGAARLLGVLSLQALPRRLLLDFRDVFQQGFAFDNVTGDVSIGQGVARTNNLRMRGVQAVVLMEGEADLARETQDLRVIVVPEINAGTASLAYAAINPAVGLGTFLAQLFLRKPLIAAGTREFRVSGSWDDPKVERVERKPGEPAPSTEPAPPAAAASAPAKE